MQWTRLEQTILEKLSREDSRGMTLRERTMSLLAIRVALLSLVISLLGIGMLAIGTRLRSAEPIALPGAVLFIAGDVLMVLTMALCVVSAIIDGR